MTGAEQDEEFECRVCRDTGDESAPLVSPCLCDGSMKYVHEECLVRWLTLKNSTSCEICSHEFSFTAVYARNTPKKLPVSDICQAFWKLLATLAPTFARYSYVCLLWTVILPLNISWGFMIWERNGFSFASVFERLTLKSIGEDMQQGIFLVVTTTVVVLSLVAFTDFYRWRAEDQNAIEAAMEQDRIQRQHIEVVEPLAEQNNLLQARNEGVANGNEEGHVPAPQAAVGVPVLEAPAPQEQAAVPPAVNNIDGIGDIPVDDIDDMGAVEIQVPFMALVGLEGHPLAALRNMVLFWFFVSLVLVFFVAFPRGVGRGFLATVLGTSSMGVNTTDVLVPGRPLVTGGIHYLVGNVVIILALVGIPSYCAQFFHSSLSSEIAGRMVEYLSAVSAILKITVLFIFKMGIYPVCLGLVWHACDIDRFKHLPSVQSEWNMMNDYPVTYGVALHWVMGIAFMLFVTVIILELKDVLHPEVLNGVVRVPNPEQNLLETLLDDSWATHARRSFVSSVIYVMLILCFLIIPTELLSILPFDCVAKMLPFRPPTSYIWVNGQLLCEITVAYLIVYYTIEPFKKALRVGLERFLPSICSLLGLELYMLPVEIPEDLMLGNEENLNVFLASKRGAEYQREEFFGPRKLFPRKKPTWCLPRLFMLVFVIWVAVIAINTIILALFALAIYSPFWAFAVPATDQHGPYGFAASSVLGYLLVNRIEKLRRNILGILVENSKIFIVGIVLVAVGVHNVMGDTPLVIGKVQMALWSISLWSICIWSLEIIRTMVGLIWLSGLIMCIIDILQTNLLPAWSTLHDILRDEKYLIGRRLMNRGEQDEESVES